jgi:hypothetical protein
VVFSLHPVTPGHRKSPGCPFNAKTGEFGEDGELGACVEQALAYHRMCGEGHTSRLVRRFLSKIIGVRLRTTLRK